MARKKKNKVKEEPVGILELDGFKVGDIIWCEYHNGTIYQGEIKNFFTDATQGNCVNIMTLEAGYRSIVLSKCSYEKVKKSRLKK
jgi:hypothetical protein